jgi:NAD(P)-dependent dehydrogenase (short-subunit alcohol dehydrogenase family)
LKLAGRNILITGASQGLGRAIAVACIREGANILICARDTDLLERTRSELAELTNPGRHVLAKRADVSRAEDVRQLFAMASNEFPELHGLVNNAGIYGPKGLVQDVDVDEWWDAVRINLLSVMLTCREAMPLFTRMGYGKIVNLSGGGATAPLPRISAYAASKAAVVRLTETLAVEAAGSRIDINSIAPGALNTRLLEEVLAAGPEKVGASFYEKAIEQKNQGGASLEKGSDLCVFLLSAASDGITGRLISAVWDPWAGLPERVDELRRTDVYTLRRIVPVDRGLEWD